jgi:hypothetical protein
MVCAERRACPKDAQAHIELPGFNSSHDRIEIGIEQLDTQVRSLTTELPNGLRQNIGRDQGRRSKRDPLTASFCSSSNPRHCGIELL